MSIILNPITIGTDFEFLVKDKSTNEIIPVPLNFGGDKDIPLSIGEGCHRLIDCVTAEANVPPVLYTEKDKFIAQINYTKEKMNLVLSQINSNYELLAQSSHTFNKSQLKEKVYNTFGCASSYDAYTMMQFRPENPVDGFRSTGFHMWLGELFGENYDIEYICNFIKYMDLYLGIPSILLDSDRERRKLYGGAGDMRYKDIGGKDSFKILVEYRTLGGGMLANDELIGFVFDNTNHAIDAYNANLPLPDGEMIQYCINNYDVDLAKKIIKDYNIPTGVFDINSVTENINVNEQV